MGLQPAGSRPRTECEAWQKRKERDKAYGPTMRGLRSSCKLKMWIGERAASLSLLILTRHSVSGDVLLKINNQFLGGEGQCWQRGRHESSMTSCSYSNNWEIQGDRLAVSEPYNSFCQSQNFSKDKLWVRCWEIVVNRDNVPALQEFTFLVVEKDTNQTQTR